MRRMLVFTSAIFVLAACSREHGAAPQGTFAPGGPVDDRGNAATARARHQMNLPPSAEAPAAYVEMQPVDPVRISDNYDAGAVEQAPVPTREIFGTVLAVDEREIRISPFEGQPVSLQLDEGADITLGGSLVAQSDLREGAQVRASFRQEDGARIADDVEVMRTPDEGPGLYQRGLEPAAP